MLIYNFISKIKSDKLQEFILKLLYMRNGLGLSYYASLYSKRFFIYCVNDCYIGSESFNWFVNLDELKRQCIKTSSYNYFPKDGDVVVDIGAGLGEEVVVYSSAVGPTGKVLAVEANAQVYDVLARIIKLNEFKNVDVVNIALNNKKEIVVLSDNNESYLAGSLQKLNCVSNGMQVQGMPFSELVKLFELERIDLLKLNIEGAERFLAEDPCPEVFNKVKNIAIACHDFRFKNEGFEFFKTKELVSDYFEGIGYKVKSQKSGIDYVDDWVYGER